MYDDIYTDADIEMMECEEVGRMVDAGICVICTAPLDDERFGPVGILEDRHDDCIDPETAAWLLDPTDRRIR